MSGLDGNCNRADSRAPQQCAGTILGFVCPEPALCDGVLDRAAVDVPSETERLVIRCIAWTPHKV